MRALPILLVVALPSLTGCAALGIGSERTVESDLWPGELVAGTGTVTGRGQQGEWSFVDAAGRLRAVANYTDDELDGPWRSWHANGEQEQEGRYVDEQRDGLWRYWHTGGVPRAQGRFEAGREVGEWLFWSARGTLDRRGAFDRGLASGRWEVFGPDGTRSAEGVYWEGRPVGSWTRRAADGSTEVEWLGAPDGDQDWTYLLERWPDGSVRREGFVTDSGREGPWVTRHAGGAPRLIGRYEQGRAVGRWHAFGVDGNLLASGEVRNGRPAGRWTVLANGVETAWDASASPPPMPIAGAWSDGRDLERGGPDAFLPTWLAELESREDRTSLLALEPAAESGASAVNASDATAALAAVTALPDVPVEAQPWTQRELDTYERYLAKYTEGSSTDEPWEDDRYGRRRGTRSEEPEGDVERARSFVGRPLDMTSFIGSDGSDFDLTSLRGRRVVLVVLRGFNGGVCVYCTAQTRAFASEDAFQRFEALDAELQVVYPGTRASFDAFGRAYASLNGAELPPYGVLYEHDRVIGERLSLEGDKIIPTTFVLDEEGIVRYAYVGLHEADRPSVDLICRQLEQL